MIIGEHKINVRTIRKLHDGEGLTLRHRRPVTYKTGWQVATHGVECTTPEEVAELIRTAEYAEACGIWLDKGIYYVDHSIRVPTKHAAIELGRKCNQLSIFGWARKPDNALVWL